MENLQQESSVTPTQDSQGVLGIQNQTVSSPANVAPINEHPMESKEQQVLASLVVRYAASLLDGLILGLIVLPVVFILVLAGVNQDSSVINLLEALVGFGYSVYFIKTHQATLGKKYFKVRVETTDNDPMTWKKAFVREVVGKFLSGLVLGIGYLWAVFDKRKQGWHDKIAKTIVVQTEPLSKGKKFFAYFLAFGLFGLAILGVLAVVVLTAINPAAQVGRARDASRIATTTRLGHSLESYFTTNSVYPNDLSWMDSLINENYLSSAPQAVTYPPGVRACTGGKRPYQGWCYKTNLGKDAVVYSRLESKDNNSKCGRQDAYVLYSTSDKRAGVWCGLSEPNAGSGFLFVP